MKFFKQIFRQDYKNQNQNQILFINILVKYNKKSFTGLVLGFSKICDNSFEHIMHSPYLRLSIIKGPYTAYYFVCVLLFCITILLSFKCFLSEDSIKKNSLSS